MMLSFDLPENNASYFYILSTLQLKKSTDIFVVFKRGTLPVFS